MKTRSDASVVLIGNELLSGRVRDENLGFLASQLWSLGVLVRSAHVIRDEVDAIADTVCKLADEHSYVFTTGGIGPTHDDRTIDGVARAFGLPVVVHPDLERMIRARLAEQGEVPDAAHLRMARTPEGAELAPPGGRVWPTVCIRNVFVLPGVPLILRRKFSALKPCFEENPFHRSLIAFAARETVLAPILERIASDRTEVEIGSYPQSDRVIVSVEGESADSVRDALAAIRNDTKGLPRADAGE